MSDRSRGQGARRNRCVKLMDVYKVPITFKTFCILSSGLNWLYRPLTAESGMWICLQVKAFDTMGM